MEAEVGHGLECLLLVNILEIGVAVDQQEEAVVIVTADADATAAAAVTSAVSLRRAPRGNEGQHIDIPVPAQAQLANRAVAARGVRTVLLRHVE